MINFRKLLDFFNAEKYKLHTRGSRDHAILVSMLKRQDNTIQSMTIDFATNSFLVSRSSTINVKERISTEYLPYNLLTPAGKALVKRYDELDLKQGDRELFDQMLAELIDTYQPRD